MTKGCYSESAERIFNLIKEERVCTPTFLIKKYNINQRTMQYAIDFLQKFGAIQVINKGMVTYLQVKNGDKNI